MAGTASPSPIYRLAEVGYGYPGSRALALREMTLNIARGEFLGVIGPNGSGKSTLLKLLAGFLAPRSGVVTLADRSIDRYTTLELARQIAVVPQHVHFIFPFTVEEIVRMGRLPHRSSGVTLTGGGRASVGDQAIVRAALEQLGLDTLADRSILELSGGERQKVLVARALVQQPKILLLDEPTAFLDLHHQVAVFRIMKELNRQGMTVVAVSHDLNLAALYSQRLVLMEQGRIRKEGTPTAVLTQTELDDLYGHTVVVDRHPLADVPRVTLQP